MSPALLSFTIAAGFVLCWSSGFVGGRLALESSMPVLWLFAWRFLLATLLAGAWWCLTRRQRVDVRGLLGEAGVGSLTMGGYLLGVILAIRFGVSAGVTALVAALQPLLAAALAGPWLGERLSWRGWAGMVVAAAGVGLCVVGDLGGPGAAPLWAYALPLGSVIAVTLGSVLAVRQPRRVPVAATLAVQLAATTLVFAVAALVASNGRLMLPALETATLSAMAWLVVLSSLGGYGFFVASLRRLGVTRTATLVYLTPPVTLLWAAAMFGEWPGRAGVAGMGVALFGVLVALRERPARRPGGEPEAAGVAQH